MSMIAGRPKMPRSKRKDCCIGVRLNPALLKKLQKISDEKTVSENIRLAIELYLSHAEKNK